VRNDTSAQVGRVAARFAISIVATLRLIIVVGCNRKQVTGVLLFRSERLHPRVAETKTSVSGASGVKQNQRVKAKLTVISVSTSTGLSFSK
jgi:hypothetical protein